MQAHLDQGCQGCLKVWTFWRLVAELSLNEASYRPTETTIREAKAAYLSREPRGLLTEIAEFARLAFDNFRQPSPAMVRTSGPTSRQLIYEAEPFVIDLRLEPDRL